MANASATLWLWAVESSAILLLGIVLSTFAARRASLAHLILMLSISAAVLVPPARWLAGRAGYGLLPAREAFSLSTMTSENVSPMNDRPDVPALARSSPSRASPAIPAANMATAAQSSPTVPTARISFVALTPVALAFWAALSAVVLARVSISIVGGLRLWCSASRPLTDGPEAAALATAAWRLGVLRSVSVRRSRAVSCPVICCWGSPRVFVPYEPAQGVDWLAVMGHELAHLRRGDHVWVLLAELVCVLMPWNPIAWFTARRLGALAERACDDLALQVAASPASYAHSLLAFASPQRSSLLVPAMISRRGLKVRIDYVLSCPRRNKALTGTVIAACFLMTGAAVTLATLSQPAPATEPKDPPAAPLAQPVARPSPGDPIEAMLAHWRATAQEARHLDISDRARTLAELNDPRAIPAMIGVIDADNSYDTIYGVGYFGLSKLTGVSYSPFHDGPWWRRWWETAKSNYPEPARSLPIPDLPKSPSGAAYRPLPQDTLTRGGLTRLLTQLLEQDKPLTRFQFHDAAAALMEIDGPRSIPFLIGVIDADNSYDTIYFVGYFALAKPTGVSYSPYHDGAWWKRWWEQNKARFPAAEHEAIPELPKTTAGKAHQPFPENLDTLEGLSQRLVAALQDEKAKPTEYSHLATELAKFNDPRAIPTMIGVIDADNSYDTIYGVGYFGLSKLTGVSYSPFHDGPWWRRWWDVNKAKFPAAESVAIPALPKTAKGRSYTPFPTDIDTFDGLARQLRQTLAKPRVTEMDMGRLGDALAALKDDRTIPLMIGAIDADNSHATIYGLGYFGIGRANRVEFSEFHDGAWWRRWWSANKPRFSSAAQNYAIPDFPKTASGAAHVPVPESFETLEGKMAWLPEAIKAGAKIDYLRYAGAIASHKDPKAIPFLIGVMEMNLTEEERGHIEEAGLRRLAQLRTLEKHDAAWWRAWWEEHKNDAQPPSGEPAHKAAENKGAQPGRETPPSPPAASPKPDQKDYVSRLAALKDASWREAFALGQEIAGLPPELGWAITRDNWSKVEKEESRQQLLKAWYYGEGFPLKPRTHAHVQDVLDLGKNDPSPKVREWAERFRAMGKGEKPAPPKAEGHNDAGADVADVPFQDLRIGGDEHERYILIGPKKSAKEPSAGFRLVLVLPGGDGSAEFRPFLQRTLKNALPDDSVIAELVAPKWSDAKDRIVWPTQLLKDPAMGFSTEQFAQAVIADAAKHVNVDHKRIDALGWSSGGPPVYTMAVMDHSPLRGAFVAMSVFKPETLPRMSGAAGRRVYILHSPQDFIKMTFPKDAETKLRGAGATTTLVTYEGGHGWHGDVYGLERAGFEWLDKNGD